MSKLRYGSFTNYQICDAALIIAV